MVLSCNNICKSFVTDAILDNISFHIEKDTKLAIVGVNGAGKTTLLRIITNEIVPDSGDCHVQSGLKLGYMAQLMEMDINHTIEEELTTVFKDVMEIEKKILSLTKNMGNLTGSDLEKAMKDYDRLNFEFEKLEGYQYQSKIRGVMNGLNFNKFGDIKIDKLSGGQKTQVSLAKLLLSAPDILLIDEPTNHLDIESVGWLEDFLKNYPKAVILVSHDRYFLDKVSNKVLEIENTHGTLYHGNYSYYAKEKVIQRQNQLKRFLDQQKIIHKQEESIRLLKSFNREKSVKRAESKEKQLEKLERLEKPEDLPNTFRIELVPRIKSGNDVIFVKNLSKSFGDKKIFENVSFHIRRGEKVALIGPNGVGKTTLFKIILNELSQNNGDITLGHNVLPGYYDQGQQSLDENKTIMEEISDTYPRLTVGEIRNVLAAFIFTGDDVFKRISSLSGGEKGRVSLSKIMLLESNFLLLDEPTNHLDLFSKEILEEALSEYMGTLLFISHDRYFINTCADKIIELSNDGATVYHGNYDYYLEKKAEFEGNIMEKAETLNPKVAYVKNKKDESDIRKKRNRLKNLKLEIPKTEAEIHDLNTELEKDSIKADYEKLEEIYSSLGSAEDKLLELYEEMEYLKEELNEDE